MLPLALALSAVLLVPLQSPPRVVEVGAGGAQPSLAEAVAAAAAGDTLRLLPGVHRGPVRITRPLVLLGAHGAIIDGGGRGTTVTVEADSVQLRGLTLSNSGRSLDRDEAAVKLVRCRGCRLVDNRVEEALHGIYLLESHDVVLRGNDISGPAGLAEARRGNGVHLFHSSGTLIESNRVRGTRDGIYFSFSSGNRISDNDVSGVRYGLHYMYSDDNVFERNRFTRNAAGAAIMFSSRIQFRENTFAEHVGYRAYGILLQTAYHVSADANRIEGNLVGIFLDMSERNRFTGNVITGNGIGIDMIASAEQNTFAGNVIAGNRTAVRKPNGDARNEWAEAGRGNYWGDPAVYDLDRDGIGDRPYAAGDPFAGLAANRPVLEIFAGTPAALALSWAERAFPMFDLPRVVDPAPLVAAPAVPAASHPTPPRGGTAAGAGGNGSAAPTDVGDADRQVAVVLLLAPLMALSISRTRRVLQRRRT